MIKNILFTLMFLLLFQCGFKIVDKGIKGVEIESISTEGYKKINFLIKNKLLNEKKDAESNFKARLDIKTNLKKDIFEKNIKNEITKYKLTVTSDISLIVDGEIKKSFKIIKSGDYRIGATSRDTGQNRINLEKNLSSEIVKELKRRLFILNNDN